MTTASEREKCHRSGETSGSWEWLPEGGSHWLVMTHLMHHCPTCGTELMADGTERLQVPRRVAEVLAHTIVHHGRRPFAEQDAPPSGAVEWWVNRAEETVRDERAVSAASAAPTKGAVTP